MSCKVTIKIAPNYRAGERNCFLVASISFDLYFWHCYSYLRRLRGNPIAYFVPFLRFEPESCLPAANKLRNFFLPNQLVDPK